MNLLTHQLDDFDTLHHFIQNLDTHISRLQTQPFQFANGHENEGQEKEYNEQRNTSANSDQTR